MEDARDFPITVELRNRVHPTKGGEPQFRYSITGKSFVLKLGTAQCRIDVYGIEECVRIHGRRCITLPLGASKHVQEATVETVESLVWCMLSSQKECPMVETRELSISMYRPRVGLCHINEASGRWPLYSYISPVSGNNR